MHAAVDARGHLVEMKLSPGQDGDGPHGRDLLARFTPGQIQHVLADTAYDGDETRGAVKTLKAKACIKPHKNRTTKKRYDKERYKHRNLIERFFGRIKQFRRVATRYEKTTENLAGFLWLAALMVDVLRMSTRPKCHSGISPKQADTPEVLIAYRPKGHNRTSLSARPHEQTTVRSGHPSNLMDLSKEVDHVVGVKESNSFRGVL